MLSQTRTDLINRVIDGDALALAALLATKPQALARLNNDVIWLGRDELLCPIAQRVLEDERGAVMVDGDCDGMN